VPVSEIELELKQGQAASLFDVALALLQDVPLRLGHEQGGARLSPGGVAAAASGQGAALPLDAAMSVEQVFLAICGNCTEQVSGNQDGVAAGEDVESLHQMRACAACARRWACSRPAGAAGRAENRTRLAGGALGEARDWDVLAGNTLAHRRRGGRRCGGAGAGGAGAGAPRTRAAQAVMSARHGMDAGHTALAAGAGRATAVRRASCGGWTGACRRSPMPPCARTSAA
jgi:hypothetical protein